MSQRKSKRHTKTKTKAKTKTKTKTKAKTETKTKKGKSVIQKKKAITKHDNRPQYCLGIDEAGRGCERGDAEVLTYEGFKTFEQVLETKDQILSFTSTGNLVWQPIISKVCLQNEENKYVSLTNKTMSAIVTPDHSFDVLEKATESQQKQKLKRVSVSNLRPTDKIPRSGVWKGTGFGLNCFNSTRSSGKILNELFGLNIVNSLEKVKIDLNEEQTLVSKLLSILFCSDYNKAMTNIIPHKKENLDYLQQFFKEFDIKYTIQTKKKEKGKVKGKGKGNENENEQREEIILKNQLPIFLNNKNLKSEFGLKIHILNLIKHFPTRALQIFLKNIGNRSTGNDQKNSLLISCISDQVRDLLEEISIKAGCVYLSREIQFNKRKQTQITIFEKQTTKIESLSTTLIHDNKYLAYCLVLPYHHNFFVRRNGSGYFTGNCLLGPMVYGGCYCEIDKKPSLSILNVDDSKVIPKKKREEIFEKICASDFLQYQLEIVSPELISHSLLKKKKYNLNFLSHDCAIKLIKSILSKVNLTQVYVDTVGDPKKYETKLKERFPTIKEIYVRKKADSLFPIVSSASICAKVIRDQLLDEWVFKEKNVDFSRNFGSGYTSDPNLKNWMKNNVNLIFGFPSIVRFSWSTSENFLEQKGATVKWKEEYTTKKKKKKTTRKTSSKGCKKPTDRKRKRNSNVKDDSEPIIPLAFFNTRNLLRVTNEDF
ncbi:ribonuclease h2 subunit a [Anaeramoeba flamelloides]|uniref:Ribonuclease n=1 Tax=Anaeramoeba flamelloides TaxID=1746091 RepID=A0AAV7Y246_9EUKA|nr:ribonuclease h2 subunit a [Anaeramoeba flamelloides]